MRTLTCALQSFRQDLEQHLQRGPVHPLECEAGLAEDDVTIVMVATFSDGEHLCSSFELGPGDVFNDEARQFTEIAFYLTAAAECEFAESAAHRDSLEDQVNVLTGECHHRE